MQYTVTGTATVTVCIEVDVDDKEDAIDVAYEEFGGIHSFCGNGGMDKLIGVSGTHESIEIDGEVEFDNVRED